MSDRFYNGTFNKKNEVFMVSFFHHIQHKINDLTKTVTTTYIGY